MTEKNNYTSVHFVAYINFTIKTILRLQLIISMRKKNQIIKSLFQLQTIID